MRHFLSSSPTRCVRPCDDLYVISRHSCNFPREYVPQSASCPRYHGEWVSSCPRSCSSCLPLLSLSIIQWWLFLLSFPFFFSYFSSFCIFLSYELSSVPLCHTSLASSFQLVLWSPLVVFLVVTFLSNLFSALTFPLVLQAIEVFTGTCLAFIFVAAVESVVVDVLGHFPTRSRQPLSPTRNSFALEVSEGKEEWPVRVYEVSLKETRVFSFISWSLSPLSFLMCFVIFPSSLFWSLPFLFSLHPYSHLSLGLCPLCLFCCIL